MDTQWALAAAVVSLSSWGAVLAVSMANVSVLPWVWWISGCIQGMLALGVTHDWARQLAPRPWVPWTALGYWSDLAILWSIRRRFLRFTGMPGSKWKNRFRILLTVSLSAVWLSTVLDELLHVDWRWGPVLACLQSVLTYSFLAVSAAYAKLSSRPPQRPWLPWMACAVVALLFLLHFAMSHQEIVGELQVQEHNISSP
eukprot:CAMPEP_0203878992 /NCGR_PEP_ID=MMETSP0359-20131031/23501_1 /ASSEMBLY_ACC=CAM_ASM_000338 /TAXON_ID=268821 /ORGANISM="Scrippsiella Hangoei, Strain SHTV-5" /LENGTH=198 /DNA_ID=CAMNT_0050798319 /DNA_START=15 /DNA_END=611 /DNA_ORIENTATION=+